MIKFLILMCIHPCWDLSLGGGEGGTEVIPIGLWVLADYQKLRFTLIHTWCPLGPIHSLCSVILAYASLIVPQRRTSTIQRTKTQNLTAAGKKCLFARKKWQWQKENILSLQISFVSPRGAPWSPISGSPFRILCCNKNILGCSVVPYGASSTLWGFAYEVPHDHWWWDGMFSSLTFHLVTSDHVLHQSHPKALG